jgi:hypothetical protein
MKFASMKIDKTYHRMPRRLLSATVGLTGIAETLCDVDHRFLLEHMREDRWLSLGNGSTPHIYSWVGREILI